MLPMQINAPPPCDAGSAIGLLSLDDGITDDSPMITAVYEAHLVMEKMRAALAELRGDDAEDPLQFLPTQQHRGSP